MAQQTAVKRATTVTEKAAPPAAKPRSRAAKTFDYSKFKQSFRNDADFSTFLGGYPNKTGILAYIYRLSPAIDNAMAGLPESSIHKTSDLAEMTREFIASKFGRGLYMLRLSDANRPKGETDVCKTWFTVDDPDLIPIYDVRALKLGDPNNQDEILRLLRSGELVRDSTTGMPRVRTQADAGEPPASASATTTNGNDLVSKEIVNTLLLKVINAGSQNPSDTMKQAIDIAKLLQPAQAQLNVEDIVERVAARLQPVATDRNGDRDFFQTYERVQSFIEKVKGPAPIAVGEGSSTMGTIVLALLDRVDRWMPAIANALQQRQPPRRAVTGRRPQPGEAEQPQKSLQDRIEEIATLGFQRMNEGINGFDFASYVCLYMDGGLQVYQTLEPHGPPGVMGFAAMNPAMAPQLADPAKRAQIEKFLSEFFSYDPSGSSGGGVEETAGAAA